MAKKILIKSQADLNIHKLVKNFFKDRHNVLLVFLFGSYASKQMKPFSDIDIGVLFDEIPAFNELNELKDNLSEILKREIDLVALNNASPIIRMRSLKKGSWFSRDSKTSTACFTEIP